MIQAVVVGGGPAGLMAAGQAASQGARVTLLEKKPNPAQKLRITGNGRCNLSNAAPLDEFISHFGRNGKFLRTAFGQFFAPELIDFLDRLRIRCVIDERGRYYPQSQRADDVADALLEWARDCGVHLNTQCAVNGILTDKNRILGVNIENQTKLLPADALILATGGASYPGTGSSGDGYRLARALGHSIVPIRPASVPLLTNAPIAPNLQGLALGPVAVHVMVNGKSKLSESGDILFTHFGLSGPAVLAISRFCVDQLLAGNRVGLEIDLLPSISEERLESSLLDTFGKQGRSQLQSAMSSWLPHRMATEFLEHIGIEPAKLCSQVSTFERRALIANLKHFDLEITGYRPLAEAQVTAGGVSLKEVDPRTMESRLVKGLYFAGEVLDLDADTGGFNLQAAFSTGWLAGRSCVS